MTVLILYGPHSFFSEGLRIASWKHAILSNGSALPWYGNLLLGPSTIIITVLFVFAAEFLLGRARPFLCAKSLWVMVLTRFFGGAALLSFAVWLYVVGHFPLIHPIPLSSFIGGLALLWKSFTRQRLPIDF